MPLSTPLTDRAETDADDLQLVRRTQDGDRQALETLIRRHQRWIYNIVVRMVYLPQDAEDATQEVLIKVLTRLSTFEGRSSFRTWLYRIVVNHVLNMKRARAEEAEWTILQIHPPFMAPGICQRSVARFHGDHGRQPRPRQFHRRRRSDHGRSARADRHGGRRHFFPPSVGETMHEHIRGSELLSFPDATHRVQVTNSKEPISAIRDFIARRAKDE